MKKSFFQRIGLTTVEEDDIPTQKGNNKSLTASIAQTNFTTAVVDSGDMQVYEKILEEAMDKRDQPGPDFLEFYKALKNVDSMPIPSDQKYKMAFGALNTMGLTKDKAINTHTVYLEAIKEEEKDFQQSMITWEKTEIKDKQTKSQELSQKNIDLQNEIQKNMGLISQLNLDVAQNTQKLATKTNQFNAAIQKERSNIEAIVNNIKTYL